MPVALKPKCLATRAMHRFIPLDDHHALQALLEEAQKQKQIFLSFVRDEGADDVLIKASSFASKIKMASEQVRLISQHISTYQIESRKQS